MVKKKREEEEERENETIQINRQAGSSQKGREYSSKEKEIFLVQKQEGQKYSKVSPSHRPSTGGVGHASRPPDASLAYC